MRRLLWIALFALSAQHCASPSTIRAQGDAHLRKANALEARGDYVHAAKERAAAAKQYHKAEERRHYEAQMGIYRD